MTPLQAIILGAVEGITEFLPISSTGHLLLVQEWFRLEGAFADTFAIAIQSGAMFAVLITTWKEWLRWPTVQRVLAGFIPTMIVGVVLYSFVKRYLLGPEVVVAMLALGAIVMMVLERVIERRGAPSVTKLEDLSLSQAALVGLAQTLAMVPGVSRSAATIIGGLLMGISREAIVRYSFLLAVPTIGAATVLDVWKQREFITIQNAELLLLGTVVSALVAGGVIRWFLRYIRTHRFTLFAIERLVVAAFAWWWLVR